MAVPAHEVIMNKNKNELLQRVLSSLFFGPLFLITCIHQGLAFNILLSSLFILSAHEWHTLSFKRIFEKKISIYLGGIVYIGFSFWGLYSISIKNALTFPFWLFCITVWIFDSFAYFLGKFIQGPKLCPSISPGKTWSGFLSGTIVASASFLLINHCLFKQPVYNYFLVSLIIPISAQCGDLLESKIKRILDVKDSGNLLPGHGGILDRFDGMLFAGLSLYILKILSG
ncbi:MAG: hypothetical protein C0432_00580 [Candidatus Puniceispirillum sp.]|nr:hypothetical protein [Candidatus Pelagibacter sp.]MBA4282778.1 hypothetical protein [Candidatus Puniceispirillum sp.]